MGLAEMENKIRESGREEMEDIKKDAEAEAKKIRDEFEKEAGKRSEKIISEAEVEAELARRRILAYSKLVVKDMIDNKRNEMIEEVFGMARKRVLELSNKDKKRILEKLASEGKKQIEEPVMFVDRKYKSLLKGAKTLNINDFGVIIRSRKGESEVNNTLSKKMEQFNKTLRHNIAEVLFK